jgi:hypothetical protein
VFVFCARIVNDYTLASCLLLTLDPTTLRTEPRALDRTTPVPALTSLDVLDMASIIRELPGTCARTRLLRSITCARTMSLLLLLCF